MLQLLLIGLVGGIITGISPCILPVLPVIFFSGGVQSARDEKVKELSKKEKRQASMRPYKVILGLIISFSLFTLAGSFLLTLFNLPQDLLRWIGLVALLLIGIGLIFPIFERILEKPFSWIPQKQVSTQRGGFGLGLALGAVYVPCAGPVLAAIAVAGAQGKIGLETIVLTLSFAIGAAIPLLFFALGGRKIAERVKLFRTHQKGIRMTGGILMILLAIGLVFNLPQYLQKLVPDYTGGLQSKVNENSEVQKALNLGGIINDQNKDLDKCSNGGTKLESCGTAPDIVGITSWFNTPDNKPIDLKQEQGKVVLIDFWAYSCINCQRSVPHIVSLYDNYKDSGLEIIGVHSPEYAFEKNESNVKDGAQKLGIDYPVAIDNNLSTWTNYRNRYWPAHYLIDSKGVVRQIQFGEGGYQTTENLIRELLQEAQPGITLPKAIESSDTTTVGETTQETYLGGNKAVNYDGIGYSTGIKEFTYPETQKPDTYALQGNWDVQSQYITPINDETKIKLSYHANKVYIVVAGTGKITTVNNGVTKTVDVTGVPTLYEVVSAGDTSQQNTLEVTIPKGIQAYSFTFG